MLNPTNKVGCRNIVNWNVLAIIITFLAKRLAINVNENTVVNSNILFEPI